ncbi:MAG: hypothetical protein ACRCVJ_18185 [Clostridium sp.]|uniref:hypothetical protein n=1 Tax=Clostridium sp. TaxID=1506 RepID=UPI003F328789
MAHNKLYRNFIILQEDERSKSSSNEKALSGYAKIEAKGDNCKITFYAQNLKKDEDYSVVLICYKKDMKQIIDMGKLNVNEVGKGEATKEYYCDNIAGLDMSYDKISGAGVCKNMSNNPVYLMYGFMNGEKLEEGWKKAKVTKCDEGKAKSKPKTYVKKDNDKKHESNKDKDKEKECREDNTDKFSEYEKTIAAKIEEEKIDPYDFRLKGGIGDFFEGLVEGFEEVKGKFKDLKYSKWFKIPIKDIEDMCDSSNNDKYSIIYYPMLNYYPYIKKHGHFMMGYKCDSKGELKYLVYAIPGGKEKDEQPYGGKSGFVTWCKGKDDDEVGYWLMFYDYKNSTIVVPSK